MDVDNIGVRVEITVVGIKTPLVQDTPHEYKNNKYEDDDTRKIAD